MTANDVKANKMLAKYMGMDAATYNPIENNEEAAAVEKAFGLDVRDGSNRPGIATWRVFKDGKRVREFVNYARNKAVVEAACYTIDPDWYK